MKTSLKTHRKKIGRLACLAVLLLFTSCSTTKRLGEGEVLYTGVKKMKIESMDGEKVPSAAESEVKDALSVKPNNPLFSPYVRTPLPIGLWVYNYFYTEKERGVRRWIYDRFAKKPVLISDVKPELRVKMAENILDNNGHFYSVADYELLPKKHNDKKARVSYLVEVAPVWRYSKVAFPEICCPITLMIDSMKGASYIHAGSTYNIDTLTAERIRITNNLRNEGYYYFRPDYLDYLADTTQAEYLVDLRMRMSGSVPEAARRPYRIGDIRVELQNPEWGRWDSVRYGDLSIRYQQPRKLRPKVLARNITLRPGAISRVEEMNATLANLTRLGVFRYVNMNVTPLDSLRGADAIDITIDAAFDLPMEAEFEVDFSSKSNSYIGPGAIFSVRHKNLFKGAEVLSVRLNGAYEWQTGSKKDTENWTSINSYEFGVTASLKVPRLIVPEFIVRETRYPSSTTFQIGANVLNRPKFFTMASFNASAGYDFQTSPYSYHTFTPVKITYNNLLKSTEAFDSTMVQNPAIAESFKDQFIPAGSYIYTYDRNLGKLGRSRVIWQTSATAAGNLFSGLAGLFGNKEPKRVFGIVFSQFVKGTSEFKYYWQVGEKNTLVNRLYLGAAYAYGNSTVVPYSEQFYIGGANSIRAFTIRSLGPGSYRPDIANSNGYYDQTGDLKLEANVEFRFNIAGGLNGAAFVDAGNIWLIRNDPLRPGGQLRMKNFFNQIALGTGAGLRYDITYLVIRLDLGIGIHTPYKNPDKKGYYNISRFKDGTGLHLAIGYPF